MNKAEQNLVKHCVGQQIVGLDLIDNGLKLFLKNGSTLTARMVWRGYDRDACEVFEASVRKKKKA